MAAEASGDPELLCGSAFGDDGRVTLKQHSTFEENQGHSVVRKRALALDYRKSPHTQVKKSKLSLSIDEEDDILDSLERNIEEYCAIELQNKKKKVACIRKIDEVYKKMQKKIEDCVCDFVQNETLHALMEDLIRVRELQLKTKDEELDAITKLIDGRAKELDLERKKLDKLISTMTVQKKEFESMTNQMKIRLKLKEEEFCCQVKETELKFGSQAKDLESQRKHLEEQLQKLKLKEKQLKGQEKELVSKNEHFEGHVKEFELKNEKFENQVKELKLKEKQLKGQEKELESKNKHFEGQVKEFELKNEKFKSQVKELKFKEEQLKCQEKELESKNKHFEGQVKEFELRNEKFETQVKELKFKEEQLKGQEKELESKNKHFEGQVNEFELKKEKFETQVKSDLRRWKQNEVSIKEENDLDEPESPDHRILVELEATLDPAKVVLDIIQKPIVPLFTNKEKAFSMDSSHICLLEQLLRISPHVKPCVRREAMKLALDLEGNMRTSSKNPLEVLGFLLLLSIYGLVPFFDEEEVLKLLKFADKSSDFIHNLVKKQQHIEAVRFICAFKLADKNQPVDLLWEYMQNAKLVSENTASLEIQDKARDQEVDTLTNVLLSISDNKLESARLLNEIQDRIVELNRRKDSSVCTGTWSILKMCNNLRKRNAGSKCGGRKEPSESKSAAAVSNGEVPQQQLSSSEPSPFAHRQSSDLNHAAKEGALGGELQNKLDFKGADEGDAETGEKDLDFNDQESGEGRAEDCVMYLKTGSSKFGSSCRFNHSIRRRSQAVKDKAGEKTEVCRYYQRHGVCKYGKDCWYIHTRGNSSDQASERSMNNPATETNVRQKQISVEEELPERPGEPECRDYLRTGDCKFKSHRKFHHPRLPPCKVSDKGVPPRPDQNVCSHYSCKFESACKYDRPHRP